MFKNKNLAFKLSFLILLSTGLIFAAAIGYSYMSSKRSMLNNVEHRARNLALATVYKIDSVLHGVEKVPRNLAVSVETGQYGENELLQLIHNSVAKNPEIFGVAIAYEPHAFSDEYYFYAPYCHKAGKNETAITFLGGDKYNYFYFDWYQIPKELHRAAWSEPYFDEGGGNIIMSTFSVPFYRDSQEQKTFLGVVTSDISLRWLTEIVSSVKIYRTGYAFLISKNGVFITHPKRNLIMRESIFSVAEALGDHQLREIGKRMIAEKQGFQRLIDFSTGEKSWMYYAPLPSSGWSLGVIFPERELFADVYKLTQNLLLIGFGGFFLLLLLIALISGTITKPLRSLAQVTGEIAKGNLEIKIPSVDTGDEVGQLASAFQNMKFALKEYITNLAETTAAKERIESELKIARSIQMSFLPRRFPPFPDKDIFEIYGTLEPAKAVGGDFFDYFLVGDDHLFFSVGDVSDKGVPAALFMAVCKTLMKGITEPGMEPSTVLQKVNVELARENDSMMFVTVFCGVLNYRTGELVYSNAGHNPPLLMRFGDEPRWLDLPTGFLLGAFEESKYRSKRILLQPGDQLLVYTDGVTEAMDANNDLYSDKRLQDVYSKNKGKPVKDLVDVVMASVKDFAGHVAQSDDITILALTFKGSRKNRY